MIYKNLKMAVFLILLCPFVHASHEDNVSTETQHARADFALVVMENSFKLFRKNMNACHKKTILNALDHSGKSSQEITDFTNSLYNNKKEIFPKSATAASQTSITEALILSKKTSNQIKNFVALISESTSYFPKNLSAFTQSNLIASLACSHRNAKELLCILEAFQKETLHDVFHLDGPHEALILETFIISTQKAKDIQLFAKAIKKNIYNLLPVGGRFSSTNEEITDVICALAYSGKTAKDIQDFVEILGLKDPKQEENLDNEEENKYKHTLFKSMNSTQRAEIIKTLTRYTKQQITSIVENELDIIDRSMCHVYRIYAMGKYIQVMFAS